MRVTSESNSGPPSRTPSIMDSPTLVRVERARLRQEASDGSSSSNGGGRPGSASQQREDSLERCLLDPKFPIPFWLDWICYDWLPKTMLDD
uniref:Uncharacterized protein n=1 Tax=Anopheles albimanus TaxID=7167 RepID=A0A182F286_ANOAL